MKDGGMIAPVAPYASRRRSRAGFTLVEILVVIAIMALLAGFAFAVLKPVSRPQYLNTARAELEQIATALENYQGKFGAYPPGNPLVPPEINTLYYELSGTRHDAKAASYTTLDGSCTISEADYGNAFRVGATGIGGIVNSTKGGGEDAAAAKNFLSGMTSSRFGTALAENSVPITNLITSVKGPDANYLPLGPGAPGVNPFRYVYPGIKNPKGYDLWIDLCIHGRTNRLSHGTSQVQILN